MAEAEGLAGASGERPEAGGYRWVLLGGIWFVYFLFGLTTASMAPLIPAIRSDLGISNASMGAILGAWPLVYIGAAIPCGILIDRLSPRLSLLVGCIVIGLSGLARAASTGEVTLYLAVGLFGIGGPLVSVGAPKLAALWFQGRDRGIAVGVYATGPVLGSAVALALTAPVLMPAFGGDWRAVMAAFGAAAIAGGALWFAIASHAAARGSLRGSADGPDRFGFGHIAEILKLPAVPVVLAMGLGIFFVNHGMNNWLPEILRAKGMSAEAAGYWASLSMVLGIVGSLIVPRYAIPQRRLILLALIFTAMLAASLLLLLPPGPVSLAAPLLLFGVARTSANAVVMLVLLEIPGIGGRRHGLVGGMFFVAAEIGGVLGPLTIGILSGAGGGFASSLLAVAAMGCLLVALAGLLSRMKAR